MPDDLTRIFVIAYICLLLMGCASVRTNCADESIVAAQIYQLRTGRQTFIAKSADGSHSMAFTRINGKRVWIMVSPRFAWDIRERDYPDDFVGGVGKVYTVEQFIKGHGFR